MNWIAIADSLPPEKQEVLLHWPVPGMAPTFRLGSVLCKPILDGDVPIWKFELDYGDAGAWVYTNRGDEQPTHWAELRAPDLVAFSPPSASPANPHAGRSTAPVVEADAGRDSGR